jgi:hypothetical protein
MDSLERLNLKKTLAVEAPRFGKGSGAKEDPLQPADSYIL